jgi:general secretion pathway protein G
MKKTQRKEFPMIERIREARKSEGGFTLIELLMVIVILGILAGVVVFAVSGINDKGKKSACQADVSTLETAVEAYYAQVGSYPTAGDPGLLQLKTAGLIHSAASPASGTVLAAAGAVTPGAACA